MDPSPHLKTLGEFLRARRAEVSPETIPAHVVSTVGQRRVTGLRREEVAQLAAVSTDYYTRLEQGRLVPSDQVLETICRAFRLPPDQTAYAEDLLRRARGYTLTAAGREPAHDRLQFLLDQLGDLPALVFGPRMDILAWNPKAAALLTDFSQLPSADRNYILIIFTLPAMRDLYDDWTAVARTCVGILRREAAQNPDDPALAALVGRLSIASNDFRRWWTEHRVAQQDFGTKVLNHPAAGRIRLNWDTFTYGNASRQQLVIWSANPGTSDAEALRTLSDKETH